MREDDARELRDLTALRALAHPLRQRILRHLHETGPATSTTLSRDLGESSGVMSYHLRQLAKHGFVGEVPERVHGRERWWQPIDRPLWIPAEGLSPAARAAAHRLLGATGPGTLPPSRRGEGLPEPAPPSATRGWRAEVRLSPAELKELLDEGRRLLDRYRRRQSAPSTDARSFVVQFLAHLEPDEQPAGWPHSNDIEPTTDQEE